MDIIFLGGKRGILTLLALIAVSSLCMAQTETNVFTQSGDASQEMKAEGLRAAHPSLPFGSKVTVTNLANDRAVEVTISGRMPASSGKIIDLSPGAASVLGIEPGETAQVRVHGALPPPPVIEPELYVVIWEPDPEPEPEPEPEIYALEPEPEPDIPEEEPQIAENIPNEDEAQQAWLALVGKEPSSAPPRLTIGDKVIIVIPGLPNPHSGKPFNVQVGAFGDSENANWAYRVLQDAGFHPSWEKTGDVYRVFLAAIPAQDVYPVIQRLGVLGFREVWVRE